MNDKLATLVQQTLSDWKPEQREAYGLDAIYELACASTTIPPYVTLALEAMGPRPGDYIELSNAWARVTIERDTYARTFNVRGDCQRGVFTTLQAALGHAATSLAAYQRGRAD